MGAESRLRDNADASLLRVNESRCRIEVKTQIFLALDLMTMNAESAANATMSLNTQR